MKNTSNCNRGFTLIELLVVVLIIGILASIALPQYQRAVEESRITEAVTNLKAIRRAIDLAMMSMPVSEINKESLDVDLPSWDNENWEYSMWGTVAFACRKRPGADCAISNKVKAIKVLRGVINMTLKDAKLCVEGNVSSCPKEIRPLKAPTYTFPTGSYALVSLDAGMVCSPDKNNSLAVSVCGSFNEQ